jgi:prolyl 4-hydroxylase
MQQDDYLENEQKINLIKSPLQHNFFNNEKLLLPSHGSVALPTMMLGHPRTSAHQNQQQHHPGISFSIPQNVQFDMHRVLSGTLNSPLSTTTTAATSTGYAPAVTPPVALTPPAIPVYTVQDRPLQQPIYNGVNPAYPGLRILNTTPPIFAVEEFLTDEECNFLIESAKDSFGPAPVVGKGAGEVSPSRTSSTCYLAREDLPDLLRKVSILTGKPIGHCELPQVGRYLPTQQYLQHYDAFDLSTEDGRRFASNGGQRTVTVLIYLNTVSQGGATRFPVIDLDIQPRRGMALIFFPATIDGLLDKQALHAALPAIEPKYVSQVWIRQSEYSGQPSKRLRATLGVPFQQPHMTHPLMMAQQH